MTIAIGCLLLVLTTFVHAVAMVVTMRGLRRMKWERWARRSIWTREGTVAGLVLVMFAASLIESGMWATAYLLVGAIGGVEEALYFSMVTYTTLGYGDVTLEPPWRLLASFQAANGIIMFGWTTAIIMAAVQRIYFATSGDETRHKP
ncbi:MAG: potassium channel family protein [Planctomycetota bacterium]|jgi:hypothetical protein